MSNFVSRIWCNGQHYRLSRVKLTLDAVARGSIPRIRINFSLPQQASCMWVNRRNHDLFFPDTMMYTYSIVVIQVESPRPTVCPVQQSFSYLPLTEMTTARPCSHYATSPAELLL